MGFLKIYLISILFGFIPYMTDRTITQIKLSKEGYNFNSKNFTIKDDLLEIFKHFFVCLIPGINVLKGIGGIFNLFHFKQTYANNKMRYILNNQIYLEKEHTDLDEFKELMFTLGDTFDVTKEQKEELGRMFDALEMHEFLIHNGYEIDPGFEEFDFEKKYAYLKKAVEEVKNQNKTDSSNKSKKYDEMTTDEKISYIKREREDILREEGKKENILTRKKNDEEK